jgi:DNA-binding NarL/FixJ family response regulator
LEVEVIATATNGETALDAVRRHVPDLAVLDLAMPGLNGIEVIRQLAKHPTRIPVVICSVETDPEVIEAVRQAGAAAYVFKGCIKNDLLPAVRLAVDGTRPFRSWR